MTNDIFADLLHGVSVRSTLLHRGNLQAPWGIYFPHGCGGSNALFHIVTTGGGLLELAPNEKGGGSAAASVWLQAGDFVLLPHAAAHSVRDCMGTRPLSLDEFHRSEAAKQRNGNPETQFLCGELFFEDAATHPLFRALPPLLLVRGEQGMSLPWLEPTLSFLACESESGRPGAETVIARLCDILFVQAVRSCLNAPLEGDFIGGDIAPLTQTPAYFRALTDAEIGSALQAIHREPQAEWSVATLAKRAAMSRSSFAARFTSLVGEPPLAYVTRWRMHIAARLLRADRHATLGEVATRIGYTSEAAFSVAFKRVVGVAPGAYRHQQTVQMA